MSGEIDETIAMLESYYVKGGTYKVPVEVINDVKDLLENQQRENKDLNNRINSIFSNIEQFIKSYKSDNLDDFFIVLRLSELIDFYNVLKEKYIV